MGHQLKEKAALFVSLHKLRDSNPDPSKPRNLRVPSLLTTRVWQSILEGSTGQFGEGSCERELLKEAVNRMRLSPSTTKGTKIEISPPTEFATNAWESLPQTCKISKFNRFGIAIALKE